MDRKDERICYRIEWRLYFDWLGSKLRLLFYAIKTQNTKPTRGISCPSLCLYGIRVPMNEPPIIVS